MKPRDFTRSPAASVFLALALAAVSPAQIGIPAGISFQGQLSLAGLGVVPSPSATEFSADGSVLSVAGTGNTLAGLIHALPVIRQPASGRILGFGVAVPHSPAPFIDAGLELAPHEVFFHTTFPTNKLGEIVSGTVYEFTLPPETASPGGLVFVTSRTR